jgi:hypothetical protein
MFNLRILNDDGIVLIEGQSVAGEFFKSTLMRLYQRTTTDKDESSFAPAPHRQFREEPLKGSGRGVAVVHRQPGHRPAGINHRVEFVRFETEPPQF